MPKRYTAEVTFDLSTSIEFDGDVNYALDTSEVEDFQDNSYFGSQEIDTSGGEVSFIVKADDEYEAERLAEDVVQDGNEVEDSSGITWTISNVSVSVSRIEEPMTLTRAIEILKALFARALDNDTIESDEEEQQALDYLLDHLATLAAQVALAEAETARVKAALSASQTALSASQAAQAEAEAETAQDRPF